MKFVFDLLTALLLSTACAKLCHGGGTVGQIFPLLEDQGGQVPLKPVANLVQEADPVTEWLKEVLDTVLEDVMTVEILEKQIINSATPNLDLSNIYHSSAGQSRFVLFKYIFLCSCRQTSVVFLRVHPAPDVRAFQIGSLDNCQQALLV